MGKGQDSDCDRYSVTVNQVMVTTVELTYITKINPDYSGLLNFSYNKENMSGNHYINKAIETLSLFCQLK